MKERTVDYILSVLESMSCQSSLYNRQKILTSFFLCGLFLLGFILYQIAPQEMSVLSDLQFLQSTSFKKTSDQKGSSIKFVLQ